MATVAQDKRNRRYTCQPLPGYLGRRCTARRAETFKELPAPSKGTVFEGPALIAVAQHASIVPQTADTRGSRMSSLSLLQQRWQTD